jgi:uncharacterized protein (TIGR02145 family)
MKARNGIWISPLLLIVMGLLLILTNGCSKKDENPSGSITDKDGNVYTSVTIGTQVWMVENLKTTKYNDGISIPIITDVSGWSNLITPAYGWYDNDASTYKTTYGALYNWYAVNTGKLCPTGWRVPTDAEWTTLTDYFGGESEAGDKLKEGGTTHWEAPNDGATNESGFTALPGGTGGLGSYNAIGTVAYLWSSTVSQYDDTYAWHREMYNDRHSAEKWSLPKHTAHSVRCLKD